MSNEYGISEVPPVKYDKTLLYTSEQLFNHTIIYKCIYDFYYYFYNT